MARALETEDPVVICQELLYVIQGLEKGQSVEVHFMTWGRRAEIVKMMTERYGAADLRKIEFHVLH